MTYDQLLTVSMTIDTKAKLHAAAYALGMSGKGAVVRAILDGRLPPLETLVQTLNPSQQVVFHHEYSKFRER